ncbi:MAG: ribose-5-phosphate isomerase RpiA [Pseudomonadota bacterium]
MLARLDQADTAKLTAAYFASYLVESGMRVGLGTGSTAAWLVKLLGARRQAEGLSIQAVATSEATEALARSCGLPTASLEDTGWLDLTIDGADEIDPQLSLIKGAGGALLREKIVASASDRMVVIADPGKMVQTLGEFPLSVEIVGFGDSATRTMIHDVLETSDVDGLDMRLRERAGLPFVTDEGHYILDLHLERIGDPERLHAALIGVPGVVETGLFCDIAEMAVIGAASGEVEYITQGDAEYVIDTPQDDRLQHLLSYID